MGQILGNELPVNAISYIRGGKNVIVSTISADGRPDSAPFTWVVAKDSRTVRLGMHQGIGSLENIRHNGQVALSITAANLHLTCRGTARIIKENLEVVPLPTAVVEVLIDEVRDDSVLGPASSQEDHLRWTERRRLVSDSTVVQALLDL